MTRNITRNIGKEEYQEYDMIPESAPVSGYSLAAFAGCLLLCVGIILYAFLAA